MPPYFKKCTGQEGMIAIIALLGVTAVTLAIVSSMAVLSIGEMKMSRSGGSLDRTFYAAEAGINDALYGLITNPAPGKHYSFTLDSINIEVTVSINPANPYQRIINSRAIDAAGNVRTIQIIADTSSFAPNFDYAIQAGEGGVSMDNNSTIDGNVYSNGDIIGKGGSETSQGRVTGMAWVADAYKLDNLAVSKDVHAHSITRSNISGEAYYQVIDASSKVFGALCPNSHCHPSSADPEPKAFPLDDGDAQKWKDDITDTANPVLAADPAQCPVTYKSGFYCLTSSGTFGNQKINANFYVGNGATLTLTGNLWVTGKIILDNNSSITIHPTPGNGSIVIISDGTVEVDNNTINDPGNPHSFILIWSLSDSIDSGSPAIYASNNSRSIIFAAPHGMLKVKNNGALNAAVAKTLYLEPNSTVNYNPSLASFYIPSDSSSAVGAAYGSWKEK